ncbi:MAG: hypothetical protein JHD23_08195, partial [Akkermansiaceae bacterium]|nr:hypothetical protein [Akkermansiaceae bacterium]
MKSRRSKLPLALILAIAIGLSLFAKFRRHYCDWVDPWVDGLNKKTLVKVADGFGTIPTASTNHISVATAKLSNEIASNELPVATKNLAARMSGETNGLQVITHADGRRSVNLAGRFMHMSAVVTRPDG